jgi:hypothetical protein
MPTQNGNYRNENHLYLDKQIGRSLCPSLSNWYVELFSLGVSFVTTTTSSKRFSDMKAVMLDRTGGIIIVFPE